MMQATHNTLSETIRTQSIELLNKHLAAAIDLHCAGEASTLERTRARVYRHS